MIVFLRHGNTGKAQENEGDKDRKLTELGIAQAQKRGEQLRDNYGFYPDIILSSSAERAWGTAKSVTISELSNTEPNANIITLDELYMPTDIKDFEEIDRMFTELGYAPLRDYLKIDTTSALNRYKKRGAAAINRAIADHSSDSANILVTGHAVMLPSIVSEMLSEQYQDLILNANLDECQGFIILNDGTVELLE